MEDNQVNSDLSGAGNTSGLHEDLVLINDGIES